MIRIGITGSIATGKSTVTNYILKKGYLVLDSDKIVRELLTRDTTCINEIAKIFPVVNQNVIDRKRLGQIIFHDQQAKENLEQIIHPRVIEELEKSTKICHDDIIFYDIPLLYESKLEYLCDIIVVVYVDEKTQLQRLVQRDNIEEVFARTIIANQMNIEEKKKRADFVLHNTTSQEDLYQQIDLMLGEIIDAKINK